MEERDIDLITIKLMKLMHDEHKQKFISKMQVSKSEIVKAYNESTYDDLVFKWGLKPIRQNGKGHKIYYKTSKVLELLEMSIHL